MEGGMFHAQLRGKAWPRKPDPFCYTVLIASSIWRGVVTYVIC